jgi:hypothetical protein
MIQKYKELLEIKRIEEEKRKKEEEIKRKIELDKLRKELEIKKQIAMSKIKQIRKPNPDRKKKKIIINENNEDKKETENENVLQLNEPINTDNDDKKDNVEETNDINNKKEENDNEEKKEEINDIEELDAEEENMKVDVDNIKYINPYMSEEDINNPNPFLKTAEMKEVKFFEIKYKKKSVKLRELAIDCQYNNFKEKQLEIEMNTENDANKGTQKVAIPSNISSYFLFSDKIFYRRNLGRRLNSFKQLDKPKDRYQESISPLSFYDNAHKKFRESPLENEKPFAFTENDAIKTFYNFKDNFLQMRKSLSARKEKVFKNTLLYRNSKPKFRIKLDTMAIIPNDTNKFPLYFLPYRRQNGLLTGPKERKPDKKSKKDKK